MYDLLESLLLCESYPGKYFGISEAGWTHSDGQMEELSNYHAGDHDKDAYEKLNPGQSWKDSPNINIAYKDYLKQGHIRFVQSSRGFNIELIVKPTSSQMKAIQNGIEDSDSGDFYFSIRTHTSYKSDGSSFQEFREEIRKMK